MVTYRLRDGLSFCRVDDGLIFLDVDQDRYFRLGAPLEHALVAHLEGQPGATEDLEKLLDRKVLTDAAPPLDHPARPAMPVAERSAVERTSAPSRARAIALLEVFAILSATRRQLKRRGLKHTIDTLVAYRRHLGDSQPAAQVDEGQIIAAADAFRRLRLYVPIQPICLLDSLALTRFLAKRGLYASIVFGVTSNPFSAHCWVQVGDLVLNDTVGHATAYTPIRVF